MFDIVVSSAELGLPGPAGCSEEELVRALTEAGRREAMAAERKLAYAAELHRRRVQQDEGAGFPPGGRGRGVAAEVALALTVGRRTAEGLLHLARDLQLRLPLTQRALACGDVDVSTVRTVADRTTGVDEALVAEVERRVLERVVGRNAGQAARVVAEVVGRVDPGAASARREHASRERDVTVRPAEDGMMSVWGLLPAPDGVALDARLQAMSRAVCAEDPRTLGQRRADALIALAHDEAALSCACGQGCINHPAPPRPVPLLRVVVDAATLLGLSDAPGELEGYGSIDADLVRRLASDATWQQLLTQAGRDSGVVATGLGRRLPAGLTPHRSVCPLDGVTTADLDARFWGERHRRFPGVELRALIQLRDRTCRHPGCQTPASRCDIDHGTPFNEHHPPSGGLTLPSNLACLCRYHHTLKTRGLWMLRHGDLGRLTFTSPTGQDVTSTPPSLDEWWGTQDEIDHEAFLDEVVRTDTVEQRRLVGVSPEPGRSATAHPTPATSGAPSF